MYFIQFELGWKVLKELLKYEGREKYIHRHCRNISSKGAGKMEGKENLFLALQELRADNTRKQKRGLHFIIASVFVWIAILIIHTSSLPILTKNLYTFFCSAPLVPLAFLISKVIGVDFQNKDNPLSNLGLLFSMNQICWQNMWDLQKRK